MSENIPVRLRDHLIPFFFQEMEGIIASHNGQTVKMIRLLSSSSLANYLYVLMDYEKKVYDFPNDKFLLYLSIDHKNGILLSGTVYVDKKGIKTELLLPIEKVRELNNLLEDIFRTALVCFIDGTRYAKMPVRKSVEAFIEKNKLLEYGFDPETIRIMYYKQKRKELLNRFQTRSSNKVIGYF